jgi:hypothetical protein
LAGVAVDPAAANGYHRSLFVHAARESLRVIG